MRVKKFLLLLSFIAIMPGVSFAASLENVPASLDLGQASAVSTTSTADYDEALEAVSYIHRFSTTPPEFVIVAGSGLGGIADIVEDSTIIDTADIPHWPRSTAPSHEGKIILGSIAGHSVIVQQGRIHFYEGYSLKAVTFPVRVFGMLGAKFYIATNAAGAVNASYSLGDIIAVKDHLNFIGTNPLIGPNEDRWNERFPDMYRAYDRKILAFLAGLGLKQGIYAALAGPSFETPAEARMLGILGADLVGMSTVPEVIVANAMGLRVCVLSCVASMDTGIDPDETLTGQEVIDMMGKTSGKLAQIITQLISELDQE